ncbi:MAG: hypothetical protein IT158_29090 [Bryobacterales bacterium]|nr:hypothetical protein [Bryobacterales bacterium]
MTHRERLLTAINHQEPDRVPICAWYTPEAERRMLRHLGVTSGATETYKAAGGPLPLLMDHDFLISWMGPCTGYYSSSEEEYTDEWGIGWKWFQNPSGAYTEMVRHPFADLKDPENAPLPDFSLPGRYEGVRSLIRDYGREYGIMGGVACTLFELSWYLRGLTQVLIDIRSDQDFYDVYLSRLMRWIEVAGRNLVEAGVDIVWIGDDFGMQNRMIIAPELFRKFFKPRYAALFAEWKRINPEVKIAFHSDGNIYPIIPDLIEIGLDILNPVQPKSMDPARVKRDFGGHLTLWGTVDIQEVLPFGTPEDVRNEVRLRMRTAGKGGGLILAPAHNIQAEVPTANILAFYDAARCDGRYPVAE